MSNLAQLAPQPMNAPCPPTHMNLYAQAVLWFLIIAIIIWFILYATKPTWVLNTDPANPAALGTISPAKVLLWAVLISLIIIIIIWLIRSVAIARC